MRNHKQIITDAGTDSFIAKSLGVPVNTMRGWKQRNSIPVKYWDWFIGSGSRTSWEELHRARLSQ